MSAFFDSKIARPKQKNYSGHFLCTMKLISLIVFLTLNPNLKNKTNADPYSTLTS